MEKINMTKVRKIEITHEYYAYTTKTVCDITNYIDALNHLASKGIKILAIDFYE